MRSYPWIPNSDSDKNTRARKGNTSTTSEKTLAHIDLDCLRYERYLYVFHIYITFLGAWCPESGGGVNSRVIIPFGTADLPNAHTPKPHSERRLDLYFVRKSKKTVCYRGKRGKQDDIDAKKIFGKSPTKLDLVAYENTIPTYPRSTHTIFQRVPTFSGTRPSRPPTSVRMHWRDGKKTERNTGRRPIPISPSTLQRPHNTGRNGKHKREAVQRWRFPYPCRVHLLASTTSRSTTTVSGGLFGPSFPSDNAGDGPKHNSRKRIRDSSGGILGSLASITSISTNTSTTNNKSTNISNPTATGTSTNTSTISSTTTSAGISIDNGTNTYINIGVRNTDPSLQTKKSAYGSSSISDSGYCSNRVINNSNHTSDNRYNSDNHNSSNSSVNIENSNAGTTWTNYGIKQSRYINTNNCSNNSSNKKSCSSSSNNMNSSSGSRSSKSNSNSNSNGINGIKINRSKESGSTCGNNINIDSRSRENTSNNNSNQTITSIGFNRKNSNSNINSNNHGDSGSDCDSYSDKDSQSSNSIKKSIDLPSRTIIMYNRTSTETDINSPSNNNPRTSISTNSAYKTDNASRVNLNANSKRNTNTDISSCSNANLRLSFSPSPFPCPNITAMDNTESAPYQPPLRPRASDYFDDRSVLEEEEDSINYDISHRRSLMTISDFRRLQQNQISTSAMDNTESAPYQPPLRPRASDYFDDRSVLAEEKDSINYDISHRRSLMTISDFRRLQNQISTSDFIYEDDSDLLRAKNSSDLDDELPSTQDSNLTMDSEICHPTSSPIHCPNPPFFFS